MEKLLKMRNIKSVVASGIKKRKAWKYNGLEKLEKQRILSVSSFFIVFEDVANNHPVRWDLQKHENLEKLRNRKVSVALGMEKSGKAKQYMGFVVLVREKLEKLDILSFPICSYQKQQKQLYF